MCTELGILTSCELELKKKSIYQIVVGKLKKENLTRLGQATGMFSLNENLTLQFLFKY